MLISVKLTFLLNNVSSVKAFSKLRDLKRINLYLVFKEFSFDESTAKFVRLSFYF